MILRIKVNDWNIDAEGRMELAAGMEDFYAMLDGVAPRTLTDYIYMRLKEARKEAGHGTL